MDVYRRKLCFPDDEEATEMAHIPSEVCEIRLSGVSEAMDLLQIDVETDVMKDKPGKDDLLCSVGFLSNSAMNHYFTLHLFS